MSDFWDNQEEISRVDKNKNEQIVISKCSRNDKTYMDVRVYKKAKDSDTYIPTSKGFNIEVTKASPIISGMEALMESLYE